MKLYTRETVETALVGRHGQVLSAVQSAYMLHSTGETSLPFSTFLRPAGYPNDRIIALPAHIGGDFDIAGIKWISSFPENLDRGQQRASSVLILNSLETGYPTALLESSQISATRTAASAALASATLHGSEDHVSTIGIIGCGTINLATIDYLFHVHPQINEVLSFDLRRERAHEFSHLVKASHPEARVRVAKEPDEILAASNTIAIARPTRVIGWTFRRGTGRGTKSSCTRRCETCQCPRSWQRPTSLTILITSAVKRRPWIWQLSRPATGTSSRGESETSFLARRCPQVLTPVSFSHPSGSASSTSQSPPSSLLPPPLQQSRSMGSTPGNTPQA